MRQYTPKATRIFGIAAPVFDIVFLSGIGFAFSEVENIGIPIALLSLGGCLSILSLVCFFSEKSRTLIIDGDKVIFPRGAERNGKTVVQRSVVKLCDIRSVKSNLYKGDKINTNDCYFHTLHLKDGTSLTVTLYAYGKEAEQEILKTIRQGSL